MSAVIEFKKPATRRELPGPEIWSAKDLARYLGMSVGWVHDHTSPRCDDPIPRIRGIGHLRFDTRSEEFLSWLERLYEGRR